MAVKTEVGTARGRFAIGLAVIAVAGLVMRVIYAVMNQDRGIKSDGIHYSYAASLLANGKGFINPLRTFYDGATIPDATHPPGWTLVLAGVTKLGFTSTLSYQITAAVVGSLTIVMVGLAGREAFGRRVGLIAAALTAVYPAIWVYERELVSESLGLFFVATMVFLTYRFRNAPGPWRALALGIVLGLSALTRSEMILLAVLIVVPVILGARAFSLAKRAGWLAIAGAATVLVITPWFLYNTTRFSEPVPLSVGLGGTMLAGNCAPTYSGELLGYYEFGCVVLLPNVSQDPSVADGQFRDAATDFIKAHKGEFVKVAAVRVGRTFSVYAPFQQTVFESERGSTMWVLTTALWMYWFLVPFAIAGIVVARRRKVPVYPLLAFVGIALFTAVLTIGAVRYRAAFEIGIVLLAALAFDRIVRAWQRGRSRSAAEPSGEPSTTTGTASEPVLTSAGPS